MNKSNVLLTVMCLTVHCQHDHVTVPTSSSPVPNFTHCHLVTQYVSSHFPPPSSQYSVMFIQFVVWRLLKSYFDSLKWRATQGYRDTDSRPSGNSVPARWPSGPCPSPKLFPCMDTPKLNKTRPPKWLNTAFIWQYAISLTPNCCLFMFW